LVRMSADGCQTNKLPSLGSTKLVPRQPTEDKKNFFRTSPLAKGVGGATTTPKGPTTDPTRHDMSGPVCIPYGRPVGPGDVAHSAPAASQQRFGHRRAYSDADVSEILATPPEVSRVPQVLFLEATVVRDHRTSFLGVSAAVAEFDERERLREVCAAAPSSRMESAGATSGLAGTGSREWAAGAGAGAGAGAAGATVLTNPYCEHAPPCPHPLQGLLDFNWRRRKTPGFSSAAATQT
jgi:hypothetical protein